jgi:hypothetical protein
MYASFEQLFFLLRECEVTQTNYRQWDDDSLSEFTVLCERSIAMRNEGAVFRTLSGCGLNFIRLYFNSFIIFVSLLCLSICGLFNDSVAQTIQS